MLSNSFETKSRNAAFPNGQHHLSIDHRSSSIEPVPYLPHISTHTYDENPYRAIRTKPSLLNQKLDREFM